jgi:hypothetical protein
MGRSNFMMEARSPVPATIASKPIGTVLSSACVPKRHAD